MPFDCGVAKYVFASVEASIPFPVDFNGVVYDSCAYCRLYHKSQNQCKRQITNDYPNRQS